MKKQTPQKKATQKKLSSKQYKSKKIELSKQLKLASTVNITQKKQGYFKGKLSNNLLKAFTTLYPDIKKDSLGKNIGVSTSTINRVLQGKTVKKETQKKITKGLNELTDAKKQIKLTLVAEHLSRYKTISKKKLQAIDKQVKTKISEKISKLKNKEFLFFKLHYSKRSITELENRKPIKRKSKK